MTTPTKICTGCTKEFPATLDYFYKDKKNSSGLKSKCKECTLEMNNEWKRNNPDKVAAQTKAWAENHPERRKEIVKRFRANNPTKNTEYMRNWRESHREQYRTLDRTYRTKMREATRQKGKQAYENNIERYRAYSRNRYALKWSLGTHTADDVIRQYEKQQGHCFWCSEPVNQLYHVDHVIPVSRGGSNSPDNIVIACPSCNHRKSKLLPYTEWAPPNPLKITGQ